VRQNSTHGPETETPEVTTEETTTAHRQAPDLTTFSRADAFELGSLLVSLARARRLPVAVRLTLGDQIVFHAGLEGSTADNDSWLARKIETVRRYDVASMQVAERFARLGVDAATDLGLDVGRYAISGGAVPIRLAGAQVGVVAVSGLTDRADHDLAVEAIEAFLRVRGDDSLSSK
jgi:uncharacterized protein (UPF0303 family)